MKHLHELLPTAAAFLELTVAKASEHVLRVATDKAKDGVFSAIEILQAPNRERGASHGSEYVYGDDTDEHVGELVDRALQMLVTKGKIVPAYTAMAPGMFRLVSVPRRSA